MRAAYFAQDVSAVSEVVKTLSRRMRARTDTICCRDLKEMPDLLCTQTPPWEWLASSSTSLQLALKSASKDLAQVQVAFEG